MPSSVTCIVQALAISQSIPVQQHNEQFLLEDAGFNCFATAHVTPCASFASGSTRPLSGRAMQPSCSGTALSSHLAVSSVVLFSLIQNLFRASAINSLINCHVKVPNV